MKKKSLEKVESIEQFCIVSKSNLISLPIDLYFALSIDSYTFTNVFH